MKYGYLKNESYIMNWKFWNGSGKLPKEKRFPKHHDPRPKQN